MLNMVASVDGATTVAGLSGRLGGTGDRQVFRTLRGLADMILVGAGTVRAEGYRPPLTPDDSLAVARTTAGQQARPRLVVVSASLDLDPTAPLFTERRPEDPPPLIATVRSAPAERRDALAEVSDLIDLGGTRVDLTGLLATLGDIGARTVLCEGGPDLNHQLLAAGLVDELCLTISPKLVGGAGTTGPGLLAGGAFAVPSGLRLDQVLTHDDFLFCRYLVV
jgi:riboflavin-specific deaminase-like protein|tara:strand:- start:604 stop:1269 length:666 start_codon:yes stop_codon:yes gene_type:complete